MKHTQPRIRSLFREAIGHDADSVWSAPGRVNLIGEHTDYNLGFVLPFTIDRRTYLAMGPRDDGWIHIQSTFSSDSVEVRLTELHSAEASRNAPEWARYPLGVIWALSEHGAQLGGLPGADLVFDSDIPAGAGLSSSAAIESSIAFALNETWSLGLTRHELATIGHRAENEIVGAPTGIMDQSASLLGKRDAAVFLDCRSRESRIVPLGLADAGLSMLVIDSGVKHEHATGGYRERRADCDRGAHALGVASLRSVTVEDLPRAEHILDGVTFRRVRHVVTENQRVLDTVATLRSAGPTAIGPLLDASHLSLRDDFEVSTPELDAAVDLSRAAGAVGARMTGGGFGGSVIALVSDDLVPAIEDAVTVGFAEHGFEAPTCFTVIPTDGARAEAGA
jgi:galactokinase